MLQQAAVLMMFSKQMLSTGNDHQLSLATSDAVCFLKINFNFAPTIANEDLNMHIDDEPKEPRHDCIFITKHFFWK